MIDERGNDDDFSEKKYDEFYGKNSENTVHPPLNNCDLKINKNDEISGLKKIQINALDKNINNIKSFFYETKFNNDNIRNLSFMFHGCKSLKSLPDISNWNTSKVSDMSYMFSHCESLESLPDLSNWNTSKVSDMSYMFSHCESLESLPDISNWNTSKVSDMSYMFSYCVSLKLLPDISNWNTSKVSDMSFMFYNCKKLIVLPRISKWNTSNIRNMNGRFGGCLSLKSIPKGSKIHYNNYYENPIFKMKYSFNIEKPKVKIFGEKFVKNNLYKAKIIYKNKMYHLEEVFNILDKVKKSYFTNLKDPKIKLLIFGNIYNLSYMFCDCFALKEFYIADKNDSYIIKDIKNHEKQVQISELEEEFSNYNQISKRSYVSENNKFIYSSGIELLDNRINLNQIIITKMKYMFTNCKCLTDIPDISKWNTKNVEDMSHMFEGCDLLTELPDISKWNTNNVKNMSFVL